MGKGALKFGGKSGYLPKPRPIFKTSIFPLKNEKQHNVGYAEGVQHPRGSQRDPTSPTYVPVSKRIELTAAEPKTKIDVEKFSSLPISQQIKLQNSELRRRFLRESYLKEEARLENAKAEEENQKVIQARLQEESVRDHEESEAFKLTIPSIEQYLTGPIMRQRTPEENQLLEQKRKANRLNHELRGKTQKATALLELYNAASSFVTTEEGLNEMVAEAFDKPNEQVKNIDNFTSLEETMNKNFDSLVRSTLLGNTANNGPGLNEVSGVLSGENDELLELAHKNAESLREKNEINSARDVERAEKDFLNNL